MATTFKRVYRSFEDFERNELRQLDNLYSSADDVVDEVVLSELEDDPYRRQDDGILFDRIDD